jgi:hypothetical protein
MQRSYLQNVLVGLDQFVGTLFGIDADITISSHVGTNGPKWAERIINWLFNDPNHCKKNVEDHTNCKKGI